MERTKIASSAAETPIVKKGPERPATNESREKSRETIKRRFDYLDAEGKRLGTAIMEFSTAEETVGNGEDAMRVVELKSFILEGFKSGRPTKIDVLELANSAGVKIRVPAPGETRVDNYYDGSTNEVMAGLPDNPISLGTLLHELGHAEQNTEDRYRELNHAAKVSRSKDFYDIDDLNWSRIGPAVREVMKAVPEMAASQNINDDVLADFDRLHDEIGILRRELGELEQLQQAASEISNPTIVKEYEAKAAMANERLRLKQDKLRGMSLLYDVRAVVRAAGLIHERDATRRAFSWMRTLKQETGVDVLADIKFKKPSPPGECAQSMVGEAMTGSEQVREIPVTDYVTHARKMLDSYGADKWKVGQQDGKGGVTPTPGGNRVEAGPESDVQRYTRQKSEEPVVQARSAADAVATEKKGFFKRLFGR